MRRSLCIAAILLVSGWCQMAAAQNVIKDYSCNAPRQFAPETPWEVGKVLKIHIGHGGRFYNCDCQENKRHSPYIYWQCQSPMCTKQRHPVLCDIKQQWHEVKQRVRWGKGCDTPHYVVPNYPLEFYGVPVADIPASGYSGVTEATDVDAIQPPVPANSIGMSSGESSEDNAKAPASIMELLRGDRGNASRNEASARSQLGNGEATADAGSRGILR